MVGINKDRIAVIVPIILIIGLGAAVANIETIFPTPSAADRIGEIRESIDFNSSREQGTNPDAPVDVVVFSDFQCPACAAAAGEISRVIEHYGDSVNVIFKHFPAKSGSDAAAEASECARDQGKFWEYHDILFANLRQARAQELVSHAENAGLDTVEFESCLYSGEKSTVVSANFAEGYKAGIRGTPTIFINNRMLTGAYPFSELKKIIDAELK